MTIHNFFLRPRAITWLPILVLGVVPLVWNDAYQLSVWTFILLGLIVVLGLDVLLGYGGQLSLGHGVFVSVGAYSTALLTTKAGWSGWLAMPSGMMVAALLALIVGIPTLRLRGYYLAMATLGFPVVLDGVLRHASAWTGGSSGVTGVPRLTFGSFVLKDPLQLYWFIFAVVCIVFFITEHLVRSRFGLALKAVHADEAAASARGINVAQTKVLAFIFSAVLASLSGSLYAHYVQFVSPDTFGISYSIMLIVLLVVGGAGRLWGAVIGTVGMMWLPEMLRSTSTWEPVVYGVILAIVLIFAPHGVAGLVRRRPSIPIDSVKSRKSVDTAIEARNVDRSEDPLLALENLSKKFGGVQAVSSLSYQFATGRVQAIIGPNGAGKSTLLALIAGTLPPSTGQVRFGDRRVESLSAHSRARLGIGRTFQHIRLIPGLTVLENIVIGGHAAPMHSDAQTRLFSVELLDRLGLAEVADAYPSEINQFQCRLTEIGAALAGRPCLLLLDEPGAGLSSFEITQLVDLMRNLREVGVSVVLVDHVMPLVMASAQEILVLEHGVLIAQGEPADVVRNEHVRSAYLGRSTAHTSEHVDQTPENLLPQKEQSA